MLIHAKSPEDLYQFGDKQSLTKQFRQLSSIHHPDKGGEVANFQIVKRLYDEAVTKVTGGYPWDNSKHVTWQGSIAKMRLNYTLKCRNELGMEYICDTRVLYSMADGDADLIGNATRMLKMAHGNLGPNEKLKHVNSLIVPGIADYAASEKHPNILIGKKSNEVPLRAVLDTYGAIPEVHIVWMIGRMMHLLCYLEWAGIVHGNISTSALYVNLANHSLHLYGGWWYSALKDEKFKALPARTMKYIAAPYKAEIRLDWALARQTIVELLGHQSPTELRMHKGLRPELISFLVNPWSAKSALALYEQWDKVRESYGPRKFVEFKAILPLKFNDVRV